MYSLFYACFLWTQTSISLPLQRKIVQEFLPVYFYSLGNRVYVFLPDDCIGLNFMEGEHIDVPFIIIKL